MRAMPLLFGALTMSTAAAAQSVAPADRAAIEHVLAGQTAAWNRHDMHAFITDMTPDVDWINVVGMHWRGREAVERAHTAFHHMPLFANSTFIPGELELRALTPDFIIAVQRSRIEGAGPTPGGGTYASDGAILTLIFVRTGQGWRIAHGHNTSIDARAAANDPGARPR